MSFRAIRDCFHRGHLYKIGDRYAPVTKEVKEGSAPRHFVLDKDYSEEEVKNAAAEDLKTRKVTIKAQKASQA